MMAGDIDKLYQPYIIKDWKINYFRYEKVKSQLQICALQTSNHLQQSRLKELLEEEIRRINSYLQWRIAEVTDCLSIIITKWSLASPDEQQQLMAIKESERYSLERSFRRLYAKTKMLEQYYDFNDFLIHKIRAEILSQEVTNTAFSNLIASLRLEVSRSELSGVREKCESAYASVFVPLHPWLAHGELQFVKTLQKNQKNTFLRVGFKTGAICTMIMAIIYLSRFHDFSQDPGLDTFLAVFDYQLFRLTWAVCIWVWDKWEINYIEIIGLQSKSYYKPNYLQIINDTLNIQLLLFFGMLVYFVANVLQFSLPFFSVSLPFTTVLSICAFMCYSRWRKRDEIPPRDLFSLAVVGRCIGAPFYPLSFRDILASACFCSFSMITKQTANAFCWVFTGGVFAESNSASQRNFDLRCSNATMKGVVTLLLLIPFWIRLMQCSRIWYLSKDLNSLQGRNALRQILSMLVVLLVYVQFHKSDEAVFYLIVCFVATLNWYWDVVIDWKLCQIVPTGDDWIPSNVFLRRVLIYKDARYYYVAIAIDLIARFLFVISLTGTANGQIFGPRFPRFFATIEVLRRCMWSIFKLEADQILANSKISVSCENKASQVGGEIKEGSGSGAPDGEEADDSGDDLRRETAAMMQRLSLSLPRPPKPSLDESNDEGKDNFTIEMTVTSSTTSPLQKNL